MYRKINQKTKHSKFYYNVWGLRRYDGNHGIALLKALGTAEPNVT
jgi:hypothetical protein